MSYVLGSAAKTSSYRQILSMFQQGDIASIATIEHLPQVKGNTLILNTGGSNSLATVAAISVLLGLDKARIGICDHKIPREQVENVQVV